MTFAAFNTYSFKTASYSCGLHFGHSGCDFSSALGFNLEFTFIANIREAAFDSDLGPMFF